MLMLFMFIYFSVFTFILIVIVIIYFVCKITINNPNTQIFHCILIIQKKYFPVLKNKNPPAAFYYLCSRGILYNVSCYTKY